MDTKRPVTVVTTEPGESVEAALERTRATRNANGVVLVVPRSPHAPDESGVHRLPMEPMR